MPEKGAIAARLRQMKEIEHRNDLLVERWRKTMKKKSEKMTAPKTLETVVKAPGRAPRVTIVANTLEALQSIVGGYIEIVSYDPNNVIVCNEEGLLLGLEENCLGLVGPFLVLGRGCGDGEFGNVVGPKAVCAELREAAPDDIL